MKFIRIIKTYQADIILALSVVLISLISFNLGRIYTFDQKKSQITITDSRDKNKSDQETTSNIKKSQAPLTDRGGDVIASKKSISKLYYFSWCSGTSRISEKNKIVFPTEAAAISAGYSLAGNCQK